MEIKTERTFETLDLYLASYLFAEGLKPSLQIVSRRVTFRFPVTDGLYKLMEEYNSNALAPVGDLVTSIRILKGKMLSMKESMPGNGEQYGRQAAQL